MQRSTSMGTSPSVSCCSDKVSPELPAAFWMACTQPRKSSLRSPWMYSVLPAAAELSWGPRCPLPKPTGTVPDPNLGSPKGEGIPGAGWAWAGGDILLEGG